MAHFAQVDNNIVRNVIVINNSDCGGGDFPTPNLSAKRSSLLSVFMGTGYKPRTTGTSGEPMRGKE